MIPAISALALGSVGGELTFAFPKALKAIGLSTENEIAVLGVEVFKVRADGYETKNLSIYDPLLKSGPKRTTDWMEYVIQNNALAADFVRKNPNGDEHVCVLTASSWHEFLEIKRFRRTL